MAGPLLHQAGGFQPIIGDFVQIVYSGSRHWQTIVCSRGDIEIYDSLCKSLQARARREMKLPSYLEIQTSQIIRQQQPYKNIPVTIPTIQQQSGAMNYGLFAIAFGIETAL